MPLVVIGSAKGSPGATTTGLGVASCWPPGPAAVVVETDVAGGDVAAWIQIAEAPGLVELAAASRTGTVDADMIWAHSRPTPGGVRVVTGPSGAGQAQAAVRALLAGPSFVAACRATAGLVVIADVGRLDPGSAAEGLAAAADAVVIVTRPSLADMSHVAARLATLRAIAAPLVVLRGDGPYTAEEVAATLGVQVLAVPEDARRASALATVSGTGGGRAPFARALRGLAGRLAAMVGTHPVPALPVPQPGGAPDVPITPTGTSGAPPPPGRPRPAPPASAPGPAPAAARVTP